MKYSSRLAGDASNIYSVGFDFIFPVREPLVVVHHKVDSSPLGKNDYIKIGSFVQNEMLWQTKLGVNFIISLNPANKINTTMNP